MVIRRSQVKGKLNITTTTPSTNATNISSNHPYYIKATDSSTPNYQNISTPYSQEGIYRSQVSSSKELSIAKQQLANTLKQN